MPETIADTSPLQYLHQCNLLHLLPTLYGRVIVPEAVAAEIRKGRALGVSLPAIEDLPWISIKVVKDAALLEMVSDLGPGEREVLALAVQSPGSLVILDDGLARRHASQLGLRLAGTLGVLVRAKRQGMLAAVAPVLDLLDRLRFRVDAATRALVLYEAGEPGG